MRNHLLTSFFKSHGWWYRLKRHICYTIMRLGVEQAYLAQIAASWSVKAKREQPTGKRCHRCLSFLPDGSRFCSQCGESVAETEAISINSKQLRTITYWDSKMRGANPLSAWGEATRKTEAFKQATGELRRNDV